MARGELMKKLLASYGRDDEFRALAEQIIDEEEKKNDRVLARSLRKTLEGSRGRPTGPKALAPLLPFPDAAADFVERVEPRHTRNDIVLGAANVRVLLGDQGISSGGRDPSPWPEGALEALVLRAAGLRQNTVR